MYNNLGKYEAQGLREDMEDVSIIKYLDIFNRQTLCIGVFDGHGGKQTSVYASEKLFSELEMYLKCITDPKTAIENSFMNTDAKWEIEKSKIPHVRDSGSTANICIFHPDKYICSNIGDTRCILVRENKVIPLSFDHKPNLPIEKNRIKEAGSFVRIDFNSEKEISRVNGVLAVSRAFGDFSFKNSGGVAKYHAVTAFPDIIEVQRDATDDFIILACDGLWDVITNEEAADYVYDCIYSKETATETAKSLVERALEKGSSDNVSCVVAFLK
jgi:serine/threonine protein phosphatase PrpC